MRGGLSLAALLIASLTLAASASAAGGGPRFVSSFSGGAGDGGELRLRASNGYSVYVSGFGDAVTLQVIGDAGVASYSVRGHASAHRVVARFGSRGRVDVRFRQTEGYRLHRPPKRCEGRVRVTRFGVFNGTIEFRGERGFTRVDAARARGTSYAEPRWKCRRHGHGKLVPEGGGEAEKPTMLEAKTRDHRIDFVAFSVPGAGLGGAAFLAQSTERRGPMDVSRSAFVFGKQAKGFEFDESLSTATVRPPRPFSGTATYGHGPGNSTRWTGTLRVALPGAPHLALTGKRFKAVLQQPPFLRPQALSWNGG